MTPREIALGSLLARVPGHHTLHDAATVATNAVDVTVQTDDSTSRTIAFAMLCSFVGTFTLTRLVVRLIRSGRGPFGNVKVGEVHVHHLVPGIVIMLLTGPAEFVIAPHGVVRTVLACVFAAGAALTLDEYALWLHLTDVYWEEQGRKSVDAVVAVSGLAGLGLLVSNPFARGEDESYWYYFGYLLVTLAFVIVALFKGRLFLGPAAMLVLPLGIYAALRLAKPGSPWFSRFYAAGTKKYDKAMRRAARIGLEDRLKTLVSGMPHPQTPWHKPEKPED